MDLSVGEGEGEERPREELCTMRIGALRRAVKREVNKLTPAYFPLIAEKLIALLPEDGCVRALRVMQDVILQSASNSSEQQDLHADLLLVLKFRYLPQPHTCSREVGQPAAAPDCHSFSEILTSVIVAELDRYPSDLADRASVVYGLFDEEDIETCLRQRRVRFIGVLAFIAKLFTRGVIKISDLSKIMGMFIPAEDEDEVSDSRRHRRRRLDETHLEGLLKAFVIMGHSLEQTVIGREWISSIILALPEEFQKVLSQARMNKWVTTAADPNQKLLRALQSQQLADNDPSCRHRPYMGENVDYPNYIMKQEAIWRMRNRASDTGSASGYIDPIETEATVEPLVSFRDPLQECWIYDPDEPPQRRGESTPEWTTSPRRGGSPPPQPKASQRNSVAVNIQRTTTQV